MILSATARNIFEAICELEVIDSHQHLPSEKDYLAFEYSGLNMFAGYIQHDLESAGLPKEFKATMRDGGHRPVEEWWPVIKTYWEQVKYTSFSKALKITARDLYQIDDINDKTIHEFAERVIADNQPGIYKKYLQDACNIEKSITCVDQVGFPDDPGMRGLSTKIMQLLSSGHFCMDDVSKWSEMSGMPIRNCDDAVNALQKILKLDIEQGAVGFKIRVGRYREPHDNHAHREFEAVQSSETSIHAECLKDFLVDKCFDIAAENDLPVAVHTGFWGDFRELDPKLMLSFVMRRQDVRFDMFHLGMPMIRDALMIGKVLHNVTLNMTWCPVISQVQTCHAIDEILDQVSLNKVVAFGGDYRCCVQKTYGHLTLAREAIASELARRIEADEFDFEEAMRIAKMWFHDNPQRIYSRS